MNRRKRILIVDDNIVIIKALSIKLRASGYDVLTAVDSAGAVTAVRREKPDLMLLDLGFPADSWDGFVILNWLRRMVEGKDLPVIIITSGEMSRYRERCLAAGAVDFFLKPLDNEELLAAIAKALKAKGGPAQAAAPAGKKILFVDDENDWRYMATMYLTDSGYEVLSARDSNEALSHAEKTRPDLVMLDLNLAGESGLTLMKLLKEKHPPVPILLYTGGEHDDTAVKAMLREGASSYLRKGTMEEMLTAVEAALGCAPVTAEPEEKKSAPVTDAPGERRPKWILLVEDDSDFSETLQLFLESHGFDVTRAPDGTEGLRQVNAGQFDIVICDLVMPNMSGDQFYQGVESAKPELCKRFVFITGQKADPRAERFIRRMHGLMLWKPFPLADLLKAIEIVWHKSSAAAQAEAQAKAQRKLTLA